MPLYLGGQRIAKLYRGSTPITRAYKGGVLTFDSSPAVPACSVAFAGHSAIVSTTTSFNHGVSFGDGDTDGYIGVGVTIASANSPFTINSVTVGGNAASPLVQQTELNHRVALFIAAKPNASSGTINVTTAANALRTAVTVFRIRNLQNTTPVDTASSDGNPPSASVAVPAGGIIFGHASGYSSGTSQAWTWTNLTERVDTFMQSGSNFETYTGACDEFASASSPTITATKTGTNTNDCLVLAAIR